jgi:endonuclease-3
VERNVFQTLLHAVFVENSSEARAEEALVRFRAAFHDLNEARVSTITELAAAFPGDPEAEARAGRLRTILQYVFERSFDFDFESLRKKPPEQAQKQLARLRDLSSFVRNSVLQVSHGIHVVALDDALRDALVWMGLLEPGTSAEEGGESLKPVVRKADAVAVLQALRCVSTDARLRPAFDPEKYPVPEGGWDLETAPTRLKELIDKGPPRIKPRKPAEAPVEAVAPPAEKKVAAEKKPSAARRTEPVPTASPTPDKTDKPTKTDKPAKAKTVPARDGDGHAATQVVAVKKPPASQPTGAKVPPAPRPAKPAVKKKVSTRRSGSH